MKHPIVLVHGFGGGRHEFKPIVTFLKQHGHTEIYEFTYKEKWGLTPTRDSSEEIRRVRRKAPPEKNVSFDWDQPRRHHLTPLFGTRRRAQGKKQ
jgi:hypothetical protein